MKCPYCHNPIARMVTKYDSDTKKLIHFTPCCSGISELSKTKYTNLKTNQKREWDRQTHALDIEQPWEVRKHEVRKGWQPNPRYIKRYQNDPTRLSMFTESDLKLSGMVTKRIATKASKGKFKNHIKIADKYS